MNLLTSTRLSTARACMRLHRHRFVEGYRPTEEPDALRFGTLIHCALEAWWLAPEKGELDAALALLDSLEADPFDRAKARAMMMGYHARWAGEPYDVLAVEAEFRAPLRNPLTGRLSRLWTIGGKIDVIVRHQQTGLVYIVEHKTSADDITPGSSYWKRLRLDGQVSIYFAGAEALGHHVSGCIYDVLGKPSQKPFQATPVEARKYTKDGRLYAAQRLNDETPAEYEKRVAEAIAEDPAAFFQRGEVVRLESELVDALYDIWQTGQQIHESTAVGRAPRNPDACVRYGRTCEFFDVCTGAASLDDPARFKKSGNPFPELSPDLAKEEPAHAAETATEAQPAT